MKATVLGSGALVPDKDRALSAYLVEAKGEKLLLDAGSGTLRQLLKACVPPKKIDAVFLTHFHPDHANELPVFFYALSLDKGVRKRSLPVYGPLGLKAFWKRLTALYPSLKKLRVQPRLTELRDGSVKRFRSQSAGSGFSVAAREVAHAKPASLAYRVTEGKRVLVYGGDTGDCSAIRAIAREADLLILECSSPREKWGGHLNALECGSIAAEAHAKKLVLSHLYPASARANVKKIAATRFKGKIVVARDFLALRV